MRGGNAPETPGELHSTATNQTARMSAQQFAVSAAGLAAAARKPVILIALWLTVLCMAVRLGVKMEQRKTHFDFSIYYVQSIEVNRGLNPYTTSFNRIAAPLHFEHFWVDHSTEPPPFLVATIPLAWFSLNKAYWTWNAVNLIALLASLFLLLGRRSGLDTRVALALAAIALLYAPVANHFYFGNHKAIILLMFVLMMRCMESSWDGTAGIILGVAGLLRAFPLGLLGYFLLRRQWKTVKYTVATCAIGGVITIAILGIGDTLGFLRGLTTLNGSAYLAIEKNIAIGATASRAFWAVFGHHPRALAELVRSLLAWGADIAVLWLAVKATLGIAPGRDRDWRVFSLWIPLSVIISPSAWPYDLILMLLPFAQMAGAVTRNDVSRRALWMGGLSYVAAFVANFAMYTSMPFFLRRDVFLVLVEFWSVSMILAYMSAYWFAADRLSAPVIQFAEDAPTAVRI
ncbi:MAG: glycosyltransferase family 87 protein [Candidatus Binataceae bacterium]